MRWKEGDEVKFEYLTQDFDNYEIDKKLYGDIPQRVSSTEGNAMLTAIKKSDQLAIRQSGRISHSIRIFNRNSTILSLLMTVIIIFQLVILIFK